MIGVYQHQACVLGSSIHSSRNVEVKSWYIHEKGLLQPSFDKERKFATIHWREVFSLLKFQGFVFIGER